MVRLSRTKFLSLDLEKSVLERFQKECGNEFVDHSVDILDYYQKSKGIQSEFVSEVLPRLKVPPVDIDFMAVSMNSWPYPQQRNIEFTHEPVNY